MPTALNRRRTCPVLAAALATSSLLVGCGGTSPSVATSPARTVLPTGLRPTTENASPSETTLMPTTEASTSPTDGLTSAPATPPAPDGAYRRVALPDNVVATYVLDHDLGADLSVHRLASWGTIVVFDAFNHEFERDLHLVDLTHPAV